MCGIAGAVDFYNPVNVDVFEMISQIKHRGPDQQKILSSNNAKLGHARLRVLDLDPKADQPFVSNDESLILVFNGEIYNYKELKKQLSEYKFKTNCDTEVIIAVYIKWGNKCITHLSGMFSFVLFDKTKKLILAARDRYGIKPFYYTKLGSQFLFCSEIKGLISVMSKVNANYPIVLKYLYNIDFESRSETFFEGVSQLMPG